MAARTHALDDFLAGVAALRVADVRVFQASFVRDLLFAEVVAEPSHSLGQALTAQGGVARGAAAVLAHGFEQNLPEGRQLGSLDDQLGAGNSSGRALHNAAGNRVDHAFDRGKLVDRLQVNVGELLHNGRGFRTFERERAPTVGFVGQRDVVHDDVFVQPLNELLANHGVRNAEVVVGERVGFELGQDMALRIEQK